jgi:hypothetical protein
MTRPSRALNITIDRPARAVYDFVRTPTNLPRWAPGLASEVRPEGDHWIGQSEFGTVTFRFVPENDFLIADHLVTVESGAQTLNPVRVIDNAEGADVVFSVVQEPGQSEDEFEQVLGIVDGDLQRLKSVLEAA